MNIFDSNVPTGEKRMKHEQDLQLGLGIGFFQRKIWKRKSHGRFLRKKTVQEINQSAMRKTKPRHGKKLFGA